ncbi:DUF308 domain-containing protein [Gordonia sp. ABSL1-1]|uniref:HdeD family acid-resistance protein n=1 Tax=Gordonia sp. ABSL1-1 TaxID=3053923 RepID=UPI0025748719|nr:DUF308 domain-containing protein [Gordonia sp. ABSL1-1]MDL9935120.1 DUF308 domain-containing protein [Gordonia sp. ABSL1-1]
MTIADYAKQFPDEVVGAVRATMIVTALVGIVIGFIALFWTRPTLTVIGVLFGISLIVAGLFRIWQAFAATFLSTGLRVALGLIGAAILIIGIIALFNPQEDSIWFLAIFIGVGWIFQGVGDLYGAATGSAHAPTWFMVVSGLVAIAAGIAMMLLPYLAVSTLVKIGGIILIALSIATLLTLPKKVPDQV